MGRRRFGSSALCRLRSKIYIFIKNRIKLLKFSVIDYYERKKTLTCDVFNDKRFARCVHQPRVFAEVGVKSTIINLHSGEICVYDLRNVEWVGEALPRLVSYVTAGFVADAVVDVPGIIFI